MSKIYEELDFTDDFMFCKVLINNPELCHELLELIIGKKVGKFTRLDKQMPIEITADGKGVRFDVYSEDDKTWCMTVRCRHQAMIICPRERDTIRV